MAIDKPVRLRILAKVEEYAIDPASLSAQVKQLQGEPFLRLQVGDYRVIFDDNGVVVMIIKIGHRREIYR